MRKDHAELPTREILSIIEQQWASIGQEEKQIWRYRSEQSHKHPLPTIPGYPVLDATSHDDGSDEEAGSTMEGAANRDPTTRVITV